MREEPGTDNRTVQRVAEQLGYGVGSVRTWVPGDRQDPITALRLAAPTGHSSTRDPTRESEEPLI